MKYAVFGVLDYQLLTGLHVFVSNDFLQSFLCLLLF